MIISQVIIEVVSYLFSGFPKKEKSPRSTDADNKYQCCWQSNVIETLFYLNLQSDINTIG